MVFISVFVRSFLFACFLGYFLIVSFPALWSILKNQSTISQVDYWYQRSSQVIWKVRRQLRELERRKSQVISRMGGDTGFVGLDIFNTVLKSLKQIGIDDVFIRVGEVSYIEEENGQVLAIPVEVKTNIGYAKLSEFFSVLHNYLAFWVEELHLKQNGSKGSQYVRIKLHVFVRNAMLSEVVKKIRSVVEQEIGEDG